MNIQQSITKKNTRTEILVSEIEKLIVNGSMVPGQRLDEMVLAKKYGVSRTPVREAIRALIAIGLVQNLESKVHKLLNYLYQCLSKCLN